MKHVSRSAAAAPAVSRSFVRSAAPAMAAKAAQKELTIGETADGQVVIGSDQPGSKVTAEPQADGSINISEVAPDGSVTDTAVIDAPTDAPAPAAGQS